MQGEAGSMTWPEAIKKGRGDWVSWIAMCAVLASGFLIKGGGSPIEHLYAVMIGAAVGVALGFGLGPAAHKGAVVISGLLAGTPFYFIGISFLVIDLLAEKAWQAAHGARRIESGTVLIVGIFLGLGCLFSLAQGFRVRKRVRHHGAADE